MGARLLVWVFEDDVGVATDLDLERGEMDGVGTMVWS